MSSLLKKITLAILSFLILFATIVPNFTKVQAQTNPISQQATDLYNLWNHKWYSEQDPFAWYKKVYDENTSPDSEIFGERYTAAQVQWVLYGLISTLWNFIPGNPQLTICAISLAGGSGDVSACTDLANNIINVLNPFNTTSNAVPVSPLAGFTSVVGQNPVSGIVYFKNLIDKFSIVTPVYAQGFGYSVAGNSVVALWRITRNISYGLAVPVVLILAFMIMFRVKISPQVVITIQSAIPKLIIALVLITFSYAIAGLVIDLMYVAIGIVAGGLTSGHVLSTLDAATMFKKLTTDYNAFTLMYLYWINIVITSLTTFLSADGLGILGTIAAIVLVIFVVWWSIKIIYVIVKNFVMVILTIVIGPLEILLGTVNGNAGFGSWFKRLISYLAVYPVMGLFFFFSFFLMVQGADPSRVVIAGNILPFSPVGNVIGGNEWVPPLSFLTGSGYRLLWLFASMIVFSEISRVPEMIQTFINGKPWAFGSGIGETTKSAVGLVSTVAKVAGIIAGA